MVRVKQRATIIPRDARRVVAVLDTMWDPSLAGRQAPRYFAINPGNLTGSRLYNWTGLVHDAIWVNGAAHLWVTNACREIVANASGRGKPDFLWLTENLWRLANHRKIDLLLVCGRTAESTFRDTGIKLGEVALRTIICPHPAARTWTRESLARMGRFVRDGSASVCCNLVGGELVVTPLTVHVPTEMF